MTEQTISEAKPQQIARQDTANAVLPPEFFSVAPVVPVGTVVSPLKKLADCPKQGNEGAPAAWICLHPEYADAMRSLCVGQEIILVSWLHKIGASGRKKLLVHPRGEAERPLQGVFSTRSPARPNPLGLHTVRITAIEGGRLGVAPLELLDGTPIVDIKCAHLPAVAENCAGQNEGRSEGWSAGQEAGQKVGQNEGQSAKQSGENAKICGALLPLHWELPQYAHDAAEAVRRTCLQGWQAGLFAGVNGNVSIRLRADSKKNSHNGEKTGEQFCITSSGSHKGNIGARDVALVEYCDDYGTEIDDGKGAGNSKKIGNGTIIEDGNATGEKAGMSYFADAPRLVAGQCPSTEAAMHAAIYRACPHALAVVHSHPPYLLALSVRRMAETKKIAQKRGECGASAPELPVNELFSVPLFATAALQKNLGLVPPFPPASAALAQGVGERAKGCNALFLQGHGLCTWGESLQEALALSEELEQLARIELLACGAVL